MATSNAELNVKIDKILEIVSTIQTQNAVQAIEIKTAQACIDEHDKAINGNGKPGLIRDVDEIKRDASIVKWVSGIIFAAVLIDATSRIIALIHPAL